MNMNTTFTIDGYDGNIVLFIALITIFLLFWFSKELFGAPTEKELWPDTEEVVARKAKKKELKDLMKTHGFIIEDGQVVCDSCHENCGQCAVTGRMRRAQELHEAL